MFKQGLILSSLFFFIACKEKPYSERLEEPAPEQNDYSFNGIVELGTPVSGATVSAYKFDGLHQGAKLAEVINSPDGTFDLKFYTDYDGPILLSATGGLYRDLVTNEMTALKPSQGLRSAITHIRMPEKTNINAWTTLALARVQADRGFWDKSVADLKDIDRINVDFSQVSYFLTGKSPNFVNIRRQEFFDTGKDGFKLDDPRVTLHLAHGGLSKLASDFSARLAENGVVISVMDLVLALVDDLSDRIFDGRNVSGSVIYMGNNHRINLNSYTMRKNLSEAIVLYAQHLQGLGKLSLKDKHHLERPGTIVDSIAWETQPELFPIAEQPKPIDREPPKISINFAGGHMQEPEFAILSGDVSFDVVVQDDSKVHDLIMLEPRISDARAGNAFGPIPFDYLPQAMQAAEVCGKMNELQEKANGNGLSLKNIVCACFEASDIFGNSTKELSCFQRPLLKSSILFPTSQTIISNRSLNDGVRVQGEIKSGLPIRSCSWRILEHLENDRQENVLLGGEGRIDGITCTIDQAIDGTKFSNGTYHFLISAEDIAGRVLKNGQNDIYQSLISFQVCKEPPSVKMNSPADYDYLASNFIPVSGSVSEPEKIQEIMVSYRGIGPNNEGVAGSQKIKPRMNDWSASLGNNLTTGQYIIELVVKDIYGNEKKQPSIKVNIDHQAPVIRGALDGVWQKPYLQETMNHRVTFVDDVNKPYYGVEPVGKAASIDWRLAPRIYRWLSRIDDSLTAPRYNISVTDGENLKEVRYKISYKCALLKDANQIAQDQYGRYEIAIVQGEASSDLKRDSEEDGYANKYCLSIWAVDQAGNATNHKVEFIWKIIVPPVGLDMNPDRYNAHLKYDDLEGIDPLLLFTGGFDGCPSFFSCLRRGVVVGHAMLSNPYSETVSVSLELKKSVRLKVDNEYFKIPANFINIVYLEYDLEVDKIGHEKVLNDSSVNLHSHETILVKFELAQAFHVGFPLMSFQGRKEIQVGFYKNGGGENAIVDGLSLITHEPYRSFPVHRHVAPWGNSHHVRHRRDLSFFSSSSR